MPTPERPLNLEQPLRIAVVDDDAMWRYLTSVALSEHGWEVRDFESGMAFFDGMSEGYQPDVLLLDAMMPETDGFEVCLRIRTLPDGDFPILMLTSLDDESSIRNAYDSGADDFFIKSNHWTLLAERIRHLVRMATMGRQLENSNACLARVHNSARVGTFDVDLGSGDLTGSAGSFTVLGFDNDCEGLPAAALPNLFGERMMSDFLGSLERTREQQVGFLVEGDSSGPDGRDRVVRIEGEPALDPDGLVRRVHCVVRDLTDDASQREQLRHLSSHDTLTGLPNRAMFLSELEEAIQAAASHQQQLAVMVVDLDHFTRINESLGQTAGDELLCEVGRLISNSASEAFCRWTPTGSGPEGSSPRPLVARLPGDEFALMLCDVRSVSEVAAAAANMQQALQRPIVVAGVECFASASFGVAVYPRDGDNAGTLLAHADRAVREVKSNGRNNVGWYVPQPNEDSRNRLALVSGLHKALDRGEFELHFQPWIDVPMGRVTGLEALVRWRRDGQLVPPGAFIPIAEETGLIVPIGEWVLREAAHRLARWRVEGLDLERVAVNIPTTHFDRDSLLSTLRAAIRTNSLTPQSLELELTETCMVRDFERTLPRLAALIEAGATLSIDDFGTGYSSLAYLTRLPISKLKVDRAFVNQLGISREGVAVCRAIVALGQSLGVQVLAEGVETPVHARTLMSIGCRVMQGFLFSPPVHGDAVPQAIEQAEATARGLMNSPLPGARNLRGTTVSALRD